MKNALKNLLVREGRKVLDNIDAGNNNLTEDEAIDLLDTFTHIAVGKQKAQELVNLQKSRFDDYVRMGKIPKGRKRKHFKELAWYKDELRQCKEMLTS